MAEKSFEYRVGWNASTNASFDGLSDWLPYEGKGATVEEVEVDLGGGSPDECIAFETALMESGFEWWLEVREKES